MNIEYNTVKLQEIIDDFSKITKIDILVYDKNLNIVTRYDHNRSFCHIIQNQTGGTQKCFCSDSELLNKCKKSLKPEVHICHAGLTDIAVPIVRDRIIFGFLIFGRIRNTKTFDEIENRLTWIKNAKEKLSIPFEKLLYLDETQIKSICRLVTAITTLILSENIVIMKKNELAANMERYISDNLDKKLSVNDLCDKFHITKNTLYENFHFSFDMTISEFITKKRIEKAKNMLAETQLPISDIAQQCGFNNNTYFFKVMKDRENTTPKHYRDSFKKK